ncbi:MAG: alanine racemase [Desulfobulbus propionicus]|nr:MAG: alanine racemase [Desulfobulbus propionicus]
MNSLNKVIVDRAALAHNVAVCRRAAGEAELLAMVKADAYGHGMIETARVFSRQGVDAFGVAEAVEGVQLRQAGFTEPILIMAGVIPDTVAAIVEYNLTPVLVDDLTIAQLSFCSGKLGQVTPVYLKMDAGMGRQGFLPEELDRVLGTLENFSSLRLAGILAHFPGADDLANPGPPVVLETFRQTVERLRATLAPGVRFHIANSGGLFYLPGAVFDMVRPGIALYGYYPDGGDGSRTSLTDRLRPAMQYRSRVLQVRDVPGGYPLGYGHTFTTSRPSRIAVLPLGYEDGYSRGLSNRGKVLLRGCFAPVVGRVSMNLTLVDVTDIAGVQTGDQAVLMGTQGEKCITADDIAGWMGSISNEVLCLLGSLNNREYIN